MEFNYRVETGPDGIRWVSVEPLMEDIVQSLEVLMKIETKNFKDEDKHILDMKILSLRTIHEFLGSIITADNLKKIKENGNLGIQNEETKEETLH